MRAKLILPEMLPQIAALEAEVFHNPWSEQALSLLVGEGAFGVACTEGDRVIAYGGMLTVLDEGQITNIATHPDFRRRGLGSAVVEALLGEARERGLAFVTLEVRESNLAAIALYQRFGFEVVGRRPGFYTHPAEAALVMQKTLSSPLGDAAGK